MELNVIGLILDIAGVFILTLMAIISYPHQRVFKMDKWWKRYWWHSWRPVFKDTKTLKWKIKWNHVVLIYGFIPPKHKGNIMGFLLILIGFILQLKFYLS